MRLREGDPLELFIDNRGIFLEKYSPLSTMECLTKDYADFLFKAYGHSVLITDTSKVLAVSGLPKNKFLDKTISKDVTQVCEDSKILVISKDSQAITLIMDGEEYKPVLIAPILIESEVVGTVILVPKEFADFTEGDKNIARCATEFIGKQMEI